MLNQFQEQLRDADEQSTARMFHFRSAHDLCSQPKHTQWLVKDIMDSCSLSCWFGEPGSMKSFLLIDLGLCVSTGRDWHGHPVLLPGPVFYIAGEGGSGINRRVKAWGIKHDMGLEGVPFYVSDRSVSLLEEESTRELVQAIDDLLSVSKEKPALVIIDTLNRNFGPGDENSTADMTRFISVIDEHLRNRFGCAVLIIHHSGLSATERARGASALRASLDWEYRLQKNSSGARTLTCTKSKDHAESPPITFMPEEIPLKGWTDPDTGEVMTSCVLCLSEGQTIDSKPLAGARKVALDALIGAGNGEKVHIDAWREAAYAAGISPTSSTEAKKKAFQRAVSDLRDAGYVDTKDDYWWSKREC